MNVLIAPDKFKGSLSAKEVCAAIEQGIRRIIPNAMIKQQPLADGGDGSLNILVDALGLHQAACDTVDPLFRPISAVFGWKGSVGFVEMAAASGLVLLKEDERSALNTTSLGTGLQIRKLLDEGVNEVLLFVGGSATNDGGMGIAKALGCSFLDKNGNKLPPAGKSLMDVDDMTLPDEVSIQINLITDVTNPLIGEKGAAHVYARQKGANDQEIDFLDNGLRHFAAVIEKKTGISVIDQPGAGAAGGVAACLVPIFGAQIRTGITSIMEILQFESLLEDVDLVITGEGKVDKQTFSGKVVSGVLEKAVKYRVPVLIVCGVNELWQSTVKGSNIYELKKAGLSTAYCMEHAYDLLVERTAEILKVHLKP